MKNARYILFFLMLAIMICLKLDNTELSNSNLEKDILINGLNKRDSTTNYRSNKKAQINLLLRSYIRDSEEEELKKDIRYLKLIIN